MAFLTEYWSKGRPQYTPSETAFHDVSSEVYCGLLVVGIGEQYRTPSYFYPKWRSRGGARRALLVVGIGEQYRTPSISIHNGVLGKEHAVLFLCLYKFDIATPQGYYAKLRRLGEGKTVIHPLRNGSS